MIHISRECLHLGWNMINYMISQSIKICWNLMWFIPHYQTRIKEFVPYNILMDFLGLVFLWSSVDNGSILYIHLYPPWAIHCIMVDRKKNALKWPWMFWVNLLLKHSITVLAMCLMPAIYWIYISLVKRSLIHSLPIALVGEQPQAWSNQEQCDRYRAALGANNVSQ